jgi:hypothetical protein
MFLVLALVVLWVSEWTLGPLLASLVLAILALDLLRAAYRARWPLLPGLLFLP